MHKGNAGILLISEIFAALRVEEAKESLGRDDGESRIGVEIFPVWVSKKVERDTAQC